MGTRLKEETEFKPKPMVYVGGQPILWHIMKIYAHYGYNEFILALGYKADYIKEYFLNQKVAASDFTLRTSDHDTKFHFESKKSNDDFTITFVDTGLTTEPGERILRCQDYIPEEDDYFMVTYGDGVTDLNINDLVEFHKSQRTIGTITGVHPHSKYGLVDVDDNGIVNKFIEKPLLSDWVNGGFMVFDRGIFGYIRPGETEHPALQRLARVNQLSMYKYNGFWLSMDTYKEVKTLEKIWNKPDCPWRIWSD